MRDVDGCRHRSAVILELHFVAEEHEPAVAFYPSDELEDDPTNWFAPNPAALLEMLREVGFEEFELTWAPRSWPGRLRRALVRTGLLPRRCFADARRDRVTIHARRRRASC